MNQLRIDNQLLAKNVFFNFIGQAISLAIGVFTIPFIVRGLGTQRFGLLSLAWVILGYFIVFDIGLGRATVKFVAEALGKGEEDKIRSFVWTAVTVQIILGIVGAGILIGVIPLLVEHVLSIPSELINEAKVTFYILAFSIPIILVSNSFRGVLEASQRFDLVNAVKIPTHALTFLLPLFGLWLGFKLPGIVILILSTRIIALFIFVVMNFYINPKLKKYSGSLSLLPRIFAFGSWITVSSVVSPVLVYLDRFLIGSLLSIGAVAYYSAPYEVVTRLWIIPASLVMTLFPAFSTLEGIKDRKKLGILFARSIKYILLILGPIILAIILFAKQVLQIWLGTEFAAKSTSVLQILALGVLINSLAHVPFSFLQGIGRPDIPAKFHLLELPIYIGIVWLLISKWEITGAAVAWTLRVILDAFLLFEATFRVYKFSLHLFTANNTTLTCFALMLLAGITYGLKTLTDIFSSLFIRTTFFTAIIVLFVWFVWKRVLDILDKNTILKIVKSWQKGVNRE